MSLKHDIQKLLNIVSAENGSNTPDFILGEYLTRCLDAFDAAVNQREKWYGRPTGRKGAPPQGTTVNPKSEP